MYEALEVFHSATSPQVPKELADFAPPLPLLLALLARLRGPLGRDGGPSPSALPLLPASSSLGCLVVWEVLGHVGPLHGRPTWALHDQQGALVAGFVWGPTAVSPSLCPLWPVCRRHGDLACRSGFLSVIIALAPLSSGAVAFFISTAGSAIFPIFVLPGSVVLPGPPLTPVRPRAAVSVPTAVSLAILFSILPALCTGDPAGRPPFFPLALPSLGVHLDDVCVLHLVPRDLCGHRGHGGLGHLDAPENCGAVRLHPFSVAWASTASTVSLSFCVASTFSFALPG